MSLPRIIFAGTPDFSVPCLNALLDSAVDVVAAYTQPDRVAGRGKKLQPSPVKKAALEAGVPVYQPPSLKPAKASQTLKELQADLMVVVAYGLILPQAVLEAPRLGCINVHASMLPRWRGAAPIQRAIEAGDTETGVCLMQMDQGLDTGAVLASRSVDITAEETGGELHDKLSQLGAKLLQDHLPDILNQSLTPREQPQAGVSYAHKLSKDESRVDWQNSAIDIANKVRAFNPWPVMSTNLNGQTLRLHKTMADPAGGNDKLNPGQIIDISPQGIQVNTKKGALCILQLQKPGGKILDVKSFLNGFSLSRGQQFD